MPTCVLKINYVLICSPGIRLIFSKAVTLSTLYILSLDSSLKGEEREKVGWEWKTTERDLNHTNHTHYAPTNLSNSASEEASLCSSVEYTQEAFMD